MKRKIARTLSEAIKKTFDFQKISPEELSAILGVSENLIYRWRLTEESAGFADLPLRRLLPVLNATGTDHILDFLEAMRGRIAVKVPRVSATKGGESEMVENYQTLTIDAVKALRDFLNEPTTEKYLNVDAALKSVLQETVRIDKYCGKKASGQYEMDFENE